MARRKLSDSIKDEGRKGGTRSTRPDTPKAARNRASASSTRPVARDAKAVGGGLASGTTDFGPATSSKSGGRTGYGTMTGRTTKSDADAAPSGTLAAAGPAGQGTGNEQGTYAAGGNAVLATGRPTRGGSRTAIGAGSPRASTGGGNLRGDPAAIPTGADSTGIGTIGGGTAGTGAGSRRSRAGDVTDDTGSRRGGDPQPNLLTPTAGQARAADDASTPGRRGWKRTTESARKTMGKRGAKRP